GSSLAEGLTSVMGRMVDSEKNVLAVQVKSRMFSGGFDLVTPRVSYFAKRVPLSMVDETNVLDPAGDQTARLRRESFFSGTYSIVINGGGFYRLKREKTFGSSWTCEGEGRLLRVSKHGWLTFHLSENAQDIARWSKARLLGDDSISVIDEAD